MCILGKMKKLGFVSSANVKYILFYQSNVGSILDRPMITLAIYRGNFNMGNSVDARLYGIHPSYNNLLSLSMAAKVRLTFHWRYDRQ